MEDFIPWFPNNSSHLNVVHLTRIDLAQIQANHIGQSTLPKSSWPVGHCCLTPPTFDSGGGGELCMSSSNEHSLQKDRLAGIV